MSPDLPQNKSFCLAPWTHLYVDPDGTAKPCCVYRNTNLTSSDYGNINDYGTVKELMNSDGYKNLRKKFLKGERDDGCIHCDSHEDAGRIDNSVRSFINLFNSEKSKQSVEDTQEDGTADPNIVYLDIRFGNICNLKCRMCGHGSSSSWWEDEIKLGEIRGWKASSPRYSAEDGDIASQYYLSSGSTTKDHPQKFIHTDCYEKIEQYLPFAEEIYFAGCEPLLYPEHNKILDKLVETNNTECRLRYNTNLSTLRTKGRDVIELWSKFENIRVGASIDAMGKGVEFIRSNLQWDVFVKNYNRIRTEAPAVELYPAATIGILNVEIFPKFNRYCIENNWTNAYPTFNPNFIQHPIEQDVRILPDWYKEHICVLYEQHIEWIKERMKDPTIECTGENQLSGLKDSLKYIREEINDNKTNSDLIDRLWRNLWKWKVVSPELDWKKQLPELYEFYMKLRPIKGREINNITPK